MNEARRRRSEEIGEKKTKDGNSAEIRLSIRRNSSRMIRASNFIEGRDSNEVVTKKQHGISFRLQFNKIPKFNKP